MRLAATKERAPGAIEALDQRGVGKAPGEAGIVENFLMPTGVANPVLKTFRRQDLPAENGGFETRWLIGVSGGLFFEPETVTPGVGEALGFAVTRTIETIELQLSFIYHLTLGRVDSCNLQGAIGIARVAGDAATSGGFTFISTIAFLSIAIGFLNLLPIPVLDGGHLVFHAYEAVAGRPPSDGALRVLMGAGLSIMIALMVFALSNDIFC